jgi:RHS repeat-associated protein
VLRLSKFWDALFTWPAATARAVGLLRRAAPRRKRPWLLEVEALEKREVLTTVAFINSSFFVSEGAGQASLTVQRSSSLGTLSVPFSAHDNTAHAGTDYVATSGSLAFSSGQTVASLTVPIIDRGLIDNTQPQLVLSLSCGSGYTLGSPANAFLKILHDDPIPVATCGCGGGLLATAPQQGLGDSRLEETSAAGVRFFDGSVSVSQDNLSSAGFGTPFGQSLDWSNIGGFGAGAANGSGWGVSQLPFLLAPSGGSTVIAVSGDTARYFDLSGSAYVERFAYLDQLSYNSGTGQYTQTDPTGAKLAFYDFSGSRPIEQRGKLVSYTDSDGNTTSVTSFTTAGLPAEIQRSNTTGSTTVTESYLYTYLGSSDVNAGLLSNVTLRRKVNSGGWTTVRQVAYSYYGTGDSNGTPGDLEFAVVKDTAGTALATSYYRYYLDGATGGFAHGLKYAFSPDSYNRLVAAYSSPTSATDTQVAPYADDYYQYDGQRRVTEVVAQGAGSSTASAVGLGTFTYSYTSSTNSPGYNAWAVKTVETLPNGNTNTVYTNAYGEVMLSAFHDTTTSQTWETFHKYDSAGRVVLTAAPAAVTGYSDTYADLLNNVSGNYQYLSDSAGLVTTYDYYGSTTATSSTAGGVAGYRQDVNFQEGETGTAIPQETWQYYAVSANGTTIAPVATDTVYRNTNGTGGETTSYAYTWFGTTAAVQSITTTLPTVTTAENGPNTADTTTTFFDTYGNPVWTKDGNGYLSYTAYDPTTGAVTETIADVNTGITSDFTGLPTGWSTPSGGGLNLVGSYQVDALGRPTAITDPVGNVTYLVYDDVNHAVRTYAGWNSGTGTPTGPTQVVRYDAAGGYTETLTMTATPHLTGGVPDGTEAISGVQTLARAYTNAAGQVVSQDAYFNLSGLTYSTAVNLGTLNTNYYRTSTDYDVNGLLTRAQTPTGTITRTVYDGEGRVSSVWVGTNDTPTSGQWSPTNNTGTANMVEVSANVYDGGGVGDGDLTQTTVYPGGSAANEVMQYYYDWRDRLVATKAGVQSTESTTVHRPILYYVYDNLGEVTTTQAYDGDGVSITSSGGVPQAPSSSLLRAQTSILYDEQGRPYQTQVYDVNPSTGAVSSTALTTNIWYDRDGQVIKTALPGGLVEKSQYDGAGRVTATYQTDGGGDSAWSDAGNVTGDNVLQETDTQYDADGNPLLVTTKQRFDNETATGALGGPTTGPLARDYYEAFYYDALGRVTADVNVGTNGGSAYTRPSSPPTGSATVLVTSYSYNAAGWLDTTTDPRGIASRTFYDNLGRVVKTVQDYTTGTPTSSSDKTTEYTYDGDGNVLTVQADQPGGAYEQTQYVYGVTTAGGSTINSNDLLAAVKYPDKTTGVASSSSEETYTVNALNQPLTYTDRNGTTHTYTYDVLGRLTSDAITTLGSGVDGSVRRIETAYDTQGNPYLLTSYNAASGGSIVTQVQRSYNGLGQLTGEYQSHSGAVNTSTTPEVQYAYTEMAGGVNNSRPTSLTYPNGRVITYNYNTGLDSTISRLSSLSDSSGTLEAYTYLGLSTVVQRAQPQAGIELTYLKQTGESNGDAGDKYIGLDRFGRVVDQRWLNTSTGTATDRFQYGYDADGNVLYKSNLVNSGLSELYHANGASNGYDGLNQLTGSARGTLSDTNSDGVPDTISTPSSTQSWTLDALGNMPTITTNGTNQTQTSNQQNELTAFGSATLAYDGNGNTTTDQNGDTLIYDAWNRLVQVKNSSSTVIASYSYDALGRRLVETEGGTSTDLYYSAQGQVLEERVSGTTLAQYVWSPVYVNALVERDRSTNGGISLNERLWVQQDANYNVTALVNGSGSVVERYLYSPYGQVLVRDASWNPLSGSAYAWHYLFQGGRYDTATGLYHFGAREYSPTLSRWMQNDPSGFAGGDTNLYRFVGNDPGMFTDPSGLSRMETGPGTNGTQNLYYIGTQFAFWDTASVWIGNYNPRTGLVQRNGLFVPYEVVRQAAEAWGTSMPNWNTFFRENAVETNPAAQGQGQLWRQAVGMDFGNESAAARGQIATLARVGIEWTACGIGLVRFGANANQVYHAFRHVISAGRDARRVEAAIRADIAANAGAIRGGLNVRNVVVDGQSFTYHAFQLPDGVINVGRITLP